MGFEVELAKYLGAATIGKSGAVQKGAELPRETAIGELPVGLASVPNPFLKLEYGIERGRTSAGKAMLGRPVLVQEIRLDNLLLPLAVITVSGRKNVITTAVAGKDFTVKEIISFEDWSIKIQGFVVEQDQGSFSPFPSEKLTQQIKLFRRNQAVRVECEYLRLFDIHNLVLTDISFPDMAGTAGAFAYEFSALSDTPVDLELK